MTQTYAYCTSITLSKEHLKECYEQSVAVDITIMHYKRAIISLLFGLCLLMFNLVSEYLAFFVITLGVLEVFGTRYQKIWWLWRQMMAKSYKSKVTILVNEVGINNRSKHVDQTIQWVSMTAIEKTELGLIIRHPKGVSYLCNSCLDYTAIGYIVNRGNVEVRGSRLEVKVKAVRAAG